jgi:hypothetical protein
MTSEKSQGGQKDEETRYRIGIGGRHRRFRLYYLAGLPLILPRKDGDIVGQLALSFPSVHGSGNSEVNGGELGL